MKSRRPSRARNARVIDISVEMESYFGLVRIGRELAIQGLMHDGLTKARAVKEWARLERAAFARREDPPFSGRFPKARIWG
jgi:hypothetical protein